MNKAEKIKRINAVLALYFSKHKGESVKAKDMMPAFIEAGIFESDRKGGLPIRQLLRDLDETNSLTLIPFVHAERKSVNTNWFFTDAPYQEEQKTRKQKAVPDSKNMSKRIPNQKNRDEDYVINLCDEILGMKAERQYRFDFLLGDTGVRLPVDAYYPSLNLVVEYRERQHTESVKFWNKPTASGIPRDEQRARYDERRKIVLPENGIKLVEISYSDLKYGSNKRLLRDETSDKQVIQNLLRINL